MRKLFGLFGILFVLSILPGIDAQQGKKDTVAKKYHRGHKAAPKAVREKLHEEAFKRHGNRVRRMPNTTAPSFDCRITFGNVLPVNDQGQCGDCFGVSAADGCSMAMIKGGLLPLDTTRGRLSSQFGLDCGAFEGGCDGGDEAQVIDYILKKGFPLTSDYGPYTANPRNCRSTGLKLYKIGDWGYCTPDQQGGRASDQDVKNCMVRYGPISVAFDAGGCDGYSWPQTMTGGGSNVDHAVLNIGWDDNHDNGDGSKGAWLGMNQWGNWGGPGGTFWIAYGSWSWNTEAIWMSAGSIPPGPIPPGPVPPTPPVPGTFGTFTVTVPGQTLPGGKLSLWGMSLDIPPVTLPDQTFTGTLTPVQLPKVVDK